MTTVLVLVGLVTGWVVWRKQQRARLLRRAAEFAQLLGFESYEQMTDAVALSARAGIDPTQARHHYTFCVQCFGERATAQAAKLIRERRFDVTFPGMGFEQAMEKLSGGLPDPEIEQLVDRVLNSSGPQVRQ